MQYCKHNTIFCHPFILRCTNHEEVTSCFLLSPIMLWKHNYFRSFCLMTFEKEYENIIAEYHDFQLLEQIGIPSSEMKMIKPIKDILLDRL